MERHGRTNSESSAYAPNGAGHNRVVTRPPSGRSETLDQALQFFSDSHVSDQRRMKMLSNAACFMGLFSAVLALADMELTIRARDPNEKLPRGNLGEILANPYRVAAVAVKSMLSVFSLLTCITIYRMYANELSYLVGRNIYHESEKLFMTSLFPSCILEMLVCLFHVPPLLDHYGLPQNLQLLVFLRLYLVAKYVKEHNMFVNNKSTALFASVTQTEISSLFLVKAYFLKYPFRLISTFYTLNVFLVGYVVYIIERPHTSYMDTVWMLVVTMTTLGFGDIVPKAVLARAFVGLASVSGIFLMALFISVVHENLQLKQQEKRILAIMENAEHLTKKKNIAASVIQCTWRWYRFSKMNEEALVRGNWFKYQQLVIFRHKMAECVRRWRVSRRSWSRADYWKKFFLADDIAMLLTDVARSVGNVELYLEKQHGARRLSKTTLEKDRVSSTSSSPSALKVKPMSHAETHPSFKGGNVQAKLVDSWSHPRRDPSVKPVSPRLPLTQPRQPSLSRTIHPANNNLGEKSTAVHVNQVQHCKFSDLNDAEGRNINSIRTRKENDSVERDIMDPEDLQGKVELLEKALDHAYFAMKTKFHDVRDSLKLSNRPPRPQVGSPPLSSFQGFTRAKVDFYGYPPTRTKNHMDV